MYNKIIYTRRLDFLTNIEMLRAAVVTDII